MITQDKSAITLFLRAGKLVNSSSLGRSRMLGQMLINRGFIQRSALEEALGYQKQQAIPQLLGQILVQRNALTKEQLRQAIRLQVEEEMWDLFSNQEGSFKFEHTDEKSIGEILVELDIEPLIIEGTRRQDEWASILKLVPSDSSIPAINPAVDYSDRETMQFSDGEWRVLSLINGFFDAGAIADRSGLGRFETFRIISSLLASGYIVVRTDDRVRILPITDPETEEIRLPQNNRSKPDSPEKPVGGSSTSRLVNIFLKRRETVPGTSGVSTEPGTIELPRDTSRMSFGSPVQFLTALANAIVESFTSNVEFYIDKKDESLAEQFWKGVLMTFPRADLVSAKGNRLDSGKFDHFLETAGLEGYFRPCFDDTVEALVRYLKMIFLLASQRLGNRVARRIFHEFFEDYRLRSSVQHSEDFYFQDYAQKVVA